MEKDSRELTIGKVREQSALVDASTRVVMVTSDPDIMKLISGLIVTACYPDTMDEHGNWTSTFKIKIEKR